MQIRRASKQDRTELKRLVQALFPDVTDLDEEVDRYMTAASEPAVFVADSNDGLVGFVEIGSRSYAEGCTTTPVAYVEAWYVDPEFRRSGIGRELFEAAERWAREAGYREIGSDTQIDNQISIAAHRAFGYTETDRIVCFLRTL
jgi:aminoglycoside 6'-N-acetyltransferase I